MVRSALVTQAVPEAGVAFAVAAANVDGHSVDVGENLTLIVRNGDVSSKTVTVETPLTVDGLAVAEVALVVAAGATGFIALDSRLFRRTAAPDAGKAYVNFSPNATSVTAAVIQR